MQEIGSPAAVTLDLLYHKATMFCFIDEEPADIISSWEKFVANGGVDTLIRHAQTAKDGDACCWLRPLIHRILRRFIGAWDDEVLNVASWTEDVENSTSA